MRIVGLEFVATRPARAMASSVDPRLFGRFVAVGIVSDARTPDLRKTMKTASRTFVFDNDTP